MERITLNVPMGRKEGYSMDLLDKIIAYECGELSESEMLELFQRLVDDGTAWTLQGHYGRTAKMLIESGLIHA